MKRLTCALVAQLALISWLGAVGSAQTAKPQSRPHGSRISVPPAQIAVDDGDTVVIRWGSGNEEVVRILGIDTPETRHLEHDIPFDQPQGPEALAFARGAFAAASSIQLIRTSTVDPYDRTLGYFYLNGKNYSTLVIRARLAYETVTQFGDNGMPAEAAEVVVAVKEVGPLPFEPPYVFRRRMGELARSMKAKGIYPKQ